MDLRTALKQTNVACTSPVFHTSNTPQKSIRNIVFPSRAAAEFSKTKQKTEITRFWKRPPQISGVLLRGKLRNCSADQSSIRVSTDFILGSVENTKEKESLVNYHVFGLSTWTSEIQCFECKDPGPLQVIKEKRILCTPVYIRDS